MSVQGVVQARLSVVATSLSVSVASLLLSSGALAHLDLTDPPQRGGDQKTGPCEGMERGDSPTTYMAGETVTIRWSETVEHENGYFRISIDPDGDDFDGDGDGEDDKPASLGMAGGNGDDSLMILDIPDRDTNVDAMPDYEATITIPDVACESCTLQVIQMMGDKEPNDARPTNHLYFRCADITIVANPDPGGMGGAAAGGAGTGGMESTGGTAAGGAPSETMGGSGGEEAAGGTTEMPGENTEPTPVEPTPPTEPEPPPAVPDPDTAVPGATPATPTTTATPVDSAAEPVTTAVTATDDGGCAIAGGPSKYSAFGVFGLLALLGLPFTRRRK